MDIITIIISLIITLLAFFFLYRRPVYIISLYLISVPVLPPIPIGGIEISILDLLAIPTALALIYIMPTEKNRIQGYFNIALLFYLFVAIISYVGFLMTTGMVSMAILMRLIRLVEIALPVLLASFLYARMGINNIIVPFLSGGAIASLLAIIFYMTGFTLRTSQSFAAQGFEYFRAAGTHGDSGSFGNLVGLTLLLSCWALLYLKEIATGQNCKILLAVSIPAGILSLAALAISLSRGGMLLFAIGFIILLIPLLRKPLKLVKIIVIVLTVLLIGSALINTFIDNSLVSISIDAFWNRITGLAELSENFEEVSSSRSYYWQKSWELFKNTPLAWTFGLGYKSLPLHYNLLADNNFNQALFEMGVLGGVTFLFMIFLGIYAGLKALYNNPNYGIIILAIWLALISNMISADIMTYWHNISAIFIILSYLYFKSNIKSETIS